MKQTKLWKKCVLIITCAVLVAGGTLGLLFRNFESDLLSNFAIKTESQTTWQTYYSSDQRFGIEFPSEPQESAQQMNLAGKNIPYQELSTELKDSIYAVSYLDYPKHWNWIGSNKLLTKAFEAFLENEQNVEALLLQQHSSHNGFPALDYHLKQDGKEIKGKFVIAGNTLYRVTVTYPLAVAENIQSKIFFDSFKING